MIAKRLAAIGLVLSLAAVCCTAAAAAPWFTDNFDSYNNGNLQGQGGWSGGGSAVRVQNTFVESGKSIKMDSLSWGSGEPSMTVTTDGSTCYLDVDVAMDTMAPIKGENHGYIKLFNSSGLEITRIYLAHQQFKVLLSSGGTLILDNTEMRRWYNIRIAIYPFNNTMDVWVDGVKKITGGATYSTPAVVARVGMAEWPNLSSRFTKTEAYIDNLTIEPPSEAATKIFSSNLYTNWEAFHIMYPFAMYDDIAGDYKMWYTGAAFGQICGSNWDQWATGIAMSGDGETWERRKFDYEPVLYAHKFYEGDVVDPATFSNIFDSIFAFGVSVIRDGSTYKMWYTGWNGDSEHIGGGITRKLNYRIGYATSPDGINWTKYSGNPILGLGSTGAMDVKGAGQPYVRKEGSNYRMWYEGLDASGVGRILYATSSDGINWTKQGTVLSPGGSGALDEKGVRNPVVVTRNGQYELWYTGEKAASPYSHAMRATSSNGGLTWSKVSGEVELHPDDPLDGNEKMHVDSVIVNNSDNSCRVFFGKENITPAPRTHDTQGTSKSKSTCIYTEVVNP